MDSPAARLLPLREPAGTGSHERPARLQNDEQGAHLVHLVRHGACFGGGRLQHSDLPQQQRHQAPAELPLLAQQRGSDGVGGASQRREQRVEE